jgi:hypothetical protein
MKRCKIRIEHSTHPPYRLKLLPATQVSHVLAYLNLTDNYALLPLSDPAKTFSPEEKLYGLIARSEADRQTVPRSSRVVCAHLFTVRRNSYEKHLYQGRGIRTEAN